MSNAMVVRCLAPIGFLLIVNSIASAQVPVDQDWARAMVDKDQLNINYKSVAKGQDVFFKIHLHNIYKEDMQITSLATSCGCISWDESPHNVLPAPIVLPSGKELTLTLRLDTVRHQGEQKGKKAIITFLNTVSGPPVATATLLVEGYIRKDVVVNPGSVHFGSVDPAKGAEQRVNVNYAGRSDWKIKSASCTNPNISVQVEEKSRGTGATAYVNYDLIVKLKQDVPVGPIRDQLILVTDDSNNPQIPIQVDGKVEPDIVVSAADFQTLTPGKPKKITVIVRSTKSPAKPFKIEQFERTRNETSIKIEKSSDYSPLHRFTLTFTPPNEPGPYDEVFYLTVSGPSDQPFRQTIEFKAKGSIQAAKSE